jgi:hypothetical protein
MALGSNQKATIAHADPAEVTQAFAKLARYWRQGRWLSDANRYRVDCINKIKTDTAHATGRVSDRHLASYIAASSAIHCLDGWAYLARAMEAELSGDVGAARHLAYYAELRAAMSILATTGIGVFDRKHFAIDRNGKCISITGPGTHEFVWDALEHWAEQPPATDLIFRIIHPGGKALSEWLSHYVPTAGFGFRGVLAKRWLLSWGLDLQRLATDRGARNESSYRPSNINKRRHPTLDQTLNFLTQFWRSHEPSGLNPFRELDRYLLRRSLAMAFTANHVKNYTPQRAPVQYSRLIEPMLHAVLPTVGDFSENKWRSFLNYQLYSSGNYLIDLAESSDPVSFPLQHLQIIARATLLLRIATGAARENIQNLSPADIEYLEFWWNPIGVTRGIWEDGYPPGVFSDLWEDIEISLDRLQTWRNAGGHTKKGLFDGVAEAIRCLSTCERIGLWSLGI